MKNKTVNFTFSIREVWSCEELHYKWKQNRVLDKTDEMPDKFGNNRRATKINVLFNCKAFEKVDDFFLIIWIVVEVVN